MKKYNSTGEVSKEETPCYLEKMGKETDARLLAAFDKCSDYVKRNCNFDIEEREIKVVGASYISYWVEDGVLFLGKGDNGWVGHSVVLSSLGTDTYSIGSCQTNPYRYENVKAFENNLLVIFLEKWETIKYDIDIKNKIYNSFEA